MRSLMLSIVVLTSCAPAAAPASRPLSVRYLDEGAVRELLAGVDLELGDLRAERDRQKARGDHFEARSAEMERLARENITRTIWGPIIGGGVGVAVTATLFLIAIGLSQRYTP